MLIKNDYNPDVLTCLANLSNDEVFTPPALVNAILDELPEDLWSNETVKFLDPFCKSGVFLREIVKRLITGLDRQFPDYEQRLNHIFKNQVFGIAITELTSLIARRTLYCSKKANSNFSVAEFFNSEAGNVFYSQSEHSWKNGKCLYCGVSKTIYERDETLEGYAYSFIHAEIPKELRQMNFDVIIGNPPYQMNDGGGSGSSAKPIYNLFVQQAKKLNPRFLCMIIPARWYSGGKGLDDFRAEMLQDKRIKKIVDYSDSRDCFPGVDIAGGVCYFLWEKSYAGSCEIVNHKNGMISSSNRFLDEFDAFIRDGNTVDIIHVVQKKSPKFSDVLISSRNPYGLVSKIRPKGKGELELISSDGSGKFPISEVPSGHDLINCWKVFISKASYDHGGQPDKNGQRRVLAKVFIGEPKSICTESYLVAGEFENRQEALNFAQYLRTKFARYMIASVLLTQNITKDKFRFVPYLDFRREWDDKSLYDFFELNEHQISIIETEIKPMEKI